MERVVRGLLLAIIFLMPFSVVIILSQGHAEVAGRYNQFAVPVVYPLEFLIAATAVIWAVLRRRTITLWPYRQLIVVAALAALSVNWAPYPFLAAVTATHLIVGLSLLVMLAAEFRDRTFLTYAVWMLTGTAALQAAWGITQFLVGHDLGLQRLGEGVLSTTTPNVAKVWDAGPHVRAYGSLPHPNLLAAYLVAAIFWVGTVIFWPFKNRPNLLQTAYTSLLILLGAGLILTFSRVALLITLINGILVVLFCYRRWHRLPRTAAIAAIGVLVVAALALPELMGRTAVQSSQETGVTNRTAGYQLAVQMINDRPAGVGAGNFVLAAPELKNELPAYQYQPAHNVPLLIGAELGGIAVALVIWFLVRIGWLFHYLKPRDKRQNTLNFSLFALSGTFIAMGMTDHFFWSLPQGLWLACLVAAAVISRIPEKQLTHGRRT